MTVSPLHPDYHRYCGSEDLANPLCQNIVLGEAWEGLTWQKLSTPLQAVVIHIHVMR